MEKGEDTTQQDLQAEEVQAQQEAQQQAEGGAAAKKKKKKKKRKSNPPSNPEKKANYDKENLERHPLPYSVNGVIKSRLQDNTHLRNINDWKDLVWKQTHPPIVDIELQYPEAKWPVGEIQDYTGENAWRTGSDDTQKRDIMIEDKLTCLRKAAEVHRQVRKYAQSIAKPGIKLVDLCKNLEACLRNLIKANGLEAGQAFPTGCSINSCAAHYTPNYGDETVLSKNFN